VRVGLDVGERCGYRIPGHPSEEGRAISLGDSRASSVEACDGNEASEDFR